LLDTNSMAMDDGAAGRRALMAALAQAPAQEIADGLKAANVAPDYVELRPIETGLVMVRGRIGGDGQPFNVGEATVTRAAVRMASGEIGFAYQLGRDREKALLAAICDAVWQNKDKREAIERHVLAPIRARQDTERRRKQERTAATRVDFFTLVRGEDA